MMIQQVSNYFKLKRMQYELLTGLGMLLPWEKAIIYLGQLFTIAFFLYRIYVAVFD